MNDQRKLVVYLLILLAVVLIGIGLFAISGVTGVALAGVGLVSLGLARIGLGTVDHPGKGLRFVLQRPLVWMAVIVFGVFPFASLLAEWGLNWWQRLVVVGLLGWGVMMIGERISQLIERRP